MTPRFRRNACPTIARPMATGDGLLARLPPAGPLSADTILAVCAAASRFGNGIVEVTARGSIQVRGLSESTAAPFAAALAAAGIHDAASAILAPPLAGLDPAETVDVRPLVRALRAAVEAGGVAALLAPKTSVVVDGGGSLHLDAIDADLRLVATADGALAVSLGGTAVAAARVGLVAARDAAAAAIAVLRLIAALGPTARGRDLDPAAAAAAIGAGPMTPVTTRRPAEPIGLHALVGGRALGLGLPFGQVDAATLAALVEAGVEGGATAFVPAEGRTLLAVGLAADAVASFRRRAAALGFILNADDPRRAVIACPGAPACAAGLMPARAIAAEVAEAAAPMLDGSVALHISGCAKGCAHPRTAALAFAGGEHGAGLVLSGRAGDPAAATIHARDLPAAAARLAAAVRRARRPGEPAADTIAGLGTRGVIAAIRRETIDA